MMLWMCLVMLVSNTAAVQDMTGKVFIFPQETNSANVRLTSAAGSSFSALTICHRTFTDLTRDHALFSLASPSKSNQALTFYDSVNKLVAPHFHDVKVGYGSLNYGPNKWHSMCSTWDASTGLVQLWLNGQPLSKKYSGTVAGGAISRQSIIVLGQDQDSYGGGFDSKQSFVGMMTDVHLWDHVISPCEIQKYTEGLSFTPGNMVNWAALDFQINGKVLVEDKIENCNSKWWK